uniref:Uncharacterized protein n=1 Tax=Moniliophthora roreri TaxID=221103 RepID=A0A0W0FIA5_MONRR
MPGKKFMRERIRDRVLYVNANNSVSFKNNLYTTYLKSEEA